MDSPDRTSHEDFPWAAAKVLLLLSKLAEWFEWFGWKTIVLFIINFLCMGVSIIIIFIIHESTRKAKRRILKSNEQSQLEPSDATALTPTTTRRLFKHNCVKLDGQPQCSFVSESNHAERHKKPGVEINRRDKMIQINAAEFEKSVSIAKELSSSRKTSKEVIIYKPAGGSQSPMMKPFPRPSSDYGISRSLITSKKNFTASRSLPRLNLYSTGNDKI